jgi:hypothetical protein
LLHLGRVFARSHTSKGRLGCLFTLNRRGLHKEWLCSSEHRGKITSCGWLRSPSLRVAAHGFQPMGTPLLRSSPRYTSSSAGFLIWRRFFLRHGVVRYCGRQFGSLVKTMRGRHNILSGRLHIEDSCDFEEAAAVDETDVEDFIREIERSW